MTENEFPPRPHRDDRVPAPLKRLKQALSGFFVLAVLASIYGGWWYYVASQFEKGLAIWMEQRRTQGLEVIYKQTSTSGFPGAVKLELISPEVMRRGDRGWTWTMEKLTLLVKPWAFGRVAFDVKGAHQWRLRQHATERKIEGLATKGSGHLNLVKGVPDRLSISLGGLMIRDPVANDALQIADAQMTLYDLKDKKPRFKVRLRDLVLPKTLRAPLGDQVRHFDAKGQITGPVLFGQWPDLLADWRDGGGALDFKSMDLDYSPLRLRGAGTLALDRNLQPIAAFSVKAEGVFKAIDALYNQGMIPAGTLFATKIALGVLSKPSEKDSHSYLDLAITVQDQTLYAGSIKLLKLAPVRW